MRNSLILRAWRHRMKALQMRTGRFFVHSCRKDGRRWRAVPARCDVRAISPMPSLLLRLLLMHVANGFSLAETAARASQLGMELSAVAVFKRLRASEEWLRWLADQQWGQTTSGRRERRPSCKSRGCHDGF